MLEANQKINRYKKLIKKYKSGNPEDELDDDFIFFMQEEISKLEAGLDDHFDNKRKEKQ